MTYENMIRWSLENGIDDFDDFIEEFGENFEFLREDFEGASPSISVPTGERVRELPVPQVQAEPEPEGLGRITDRMRDIATSFINFFRD